MEAEFAARTAKTNGLLFTERNLPSTKSPKNAASLSGTSSPSNRVPTQVHFKINNPYSSIEIHPTFIKMILEKSLPAQATALPTKPKPSSKPASTSFKTKVSKLSRYGTNQP